MWLSLTLWACAPFSPGSDLAAGDPTVLAQGEICVERPLESGDPCTHTFGGEYAHGGCSAGFQCCDGAWGSHGACGECACTEPSGAEGCAPEPVGATCTHTYGGVYADGGCSAGYQCCDGAWGPHGTCGECACTEATGSAGCGDARNLDCIPAFVGQAGPIPAEMRQAMTGVTWEPDCPVHLDDLALVTAGHWDLDGQPANGALIVRADVAPVVLDVLRVAWESRYPIERMEPVHLYGGSDDASMAANNTSAFNCRAITGGTAWSQHSFGDAIDLNPRMNPYVTQGGTVLPPAGTAYLDRDPSDPGVLVGSSPVTQAFFQHGWRWGGYWSGLKDYQHFSANGR